MFFEVESIWSTKEWNDFFSPELCKMNTLSITKWSVYYVSKPEIWKITFSKELGILNTVSGSDHELHGSGSDVQN